MKKRQGREAQQFREGTSGRGMGFRRNSGMARDMGIGCGRGRKIGIKNGKRNRSVPVRPLSKRDTLSQQDVIANQKEEPEILKNQGEKTNGKALESESRILEIKKGSKSFHAVAVVDAQVCTACGACEDICPDGAIFIVDETAVINQSLCTGCGLCMEECPTEAISLQEV